jgi:hypothetical protein
MRHHVPFVRPPTDLLDTGHTDRDSICYSARHRLSDIKVYIPYSSRLHRLFLSSSSSAPSSLRTFVFYTILTA